MDSTFFEQPILNSPYEYLSRPWELDPSGQPTNRILPERRKVAFITPIPKPKKQEGIQQEKVVFDAAAQALATEAQQYDLTGFIGGVRHRVDRWRELPDPNAWSVTPETARLLTHWRSHRFGDIRPFFCQVEAVETAIWLTEVAPTLGREGRRFLDQIDAAGEGANPGLARLALKLATGAGKTTVMAMIIAWQTVKRGAPAGQPAVHARLSGGGPRRDDPGPAASAPAERSGQLLRQRPLRADVRAVGAGRHRGAAVLHHRLQQHVDLEARLRLRLRLLPRE